MTTNPEWQKRLEAAVEAFDRSQAAPVWLKLTLHDALAVGPDLAPSAEPDVLPPAFFYPH